MNEKKVKKHPLRWALLAVLVAAVAAGCVFSRYGVFGMACVSRGLFPWRPHSL